MTPNEAHDGQHLKPTIHNVMNCFFCLKQKPNCRGYTMSLTEDASPLLKRFENAQFIICQECWEKSKTDPNFLKHAIVQFVIDEDKLSQLPKKRKKKK